MPLQPDLVRAFNRVCPWPRVKPWLARRAAPSLPTSQGPRLYERIDGDLRFHLDLARPADRMIYLNAYQPVLTGLLKRVLRPGDAYLDVGASVGYFVAVAARRVGPRGRVHAYEPQPYHCDIIRRNLDANGLGNVTLRPVACWSSPGTAVLHHFAGAKPTCSSLAARADQAVEATIEVPTVRLDDEVPPPVRLIKADVEGAEREVLRGAERLLVSRPRPRLVLEFNPTTTSGFGYHPLDLLDWLLGLGPYRLSLLRSRRRTPTGRDALARVFEADPTRTCNVYLEPTEQ